MATALYINRYKNYTDRGAFVQGELWRRREVDEKEIEVGKELWIDTNKARVTHYDGERIDFDFQGQTFSIKVGEEKQVDESIFSQEYGVTCYLITTVKVISTEIFYKGDFQQEDTILQRLKGPIGNGVVLYPTGDRFEGYFHLNYAHINGPAYCAEGRYDFADGSYIEHAWIETSSDLKTFALKGVYRVKHPKGPDSIAMFVGGKRYGVELFLDEKRPRVREWYANCRENRMNVIDNVPEDYNLDVVDYHLEEDAKEGCLKVTMTLKDGLERYQVIQEGGSYINNNYGQSVYEPAVTATVYYPDGNSIDHRGDGLRLLSPYHGCITMHCAATFKKRNELWEDGKMKEATDWEYDIRAAKSRLLPDPFGTKIKIDAEIWADGHICYGGQWIYDGEIKNNRPEGHGVLVGGFEKEGCRYEGDFHKGRCHGNGVFDNEKAGIRQEGEWIEGLFLEPNAATRPIRLHARHGHHEWSTGGSHPWEYHESDFTAQLGKMDFDGFSSFEIVRIENNCITITHWRDTYLLTPGETLHLNMEIEGREWSDGCVYDGDDYTLDLTWAKKDKTL